MQLLRASHAAQMQELKNHLQSTISCNVKPTTEILALRKSESMLAKQKKYVPFTLIAFNNLI